MNGSPLTLTIGALYAIMHSIALADVTHQYVGAVGSQKAQFTLTWRDNGTVTGSYFCPGGSGRIYALRGSNFTQGELELHEFTDGQHSATCYLAKSEENARIVWRGVMHNDDGRDRVIYFYRSQ